MATISKNVKDLIKDCVVRETMKPKKAEYQEAHNAFMNSIYRHFVPVETEEVMKTLPEGFFMKTKYFRYSIGSDRIHENLAEEMLVPHIAAERWGGFSLEDPTLIAEHNRMKNWDRSIHQQEQDLTAKLNTLLASVNTDKQLDAAWPEGRAFYSGFFHKEVPNLPVIVVSELNDLITKLRGE